MKETIGEIEGCIKKHKKWIIVLILIAIFMNALNLSIVTPGWEIYNQIGAFDFNNTVYTDLPGMHGVYAKVDVDEATYGVPTVMSELGDVHHVDFAGKERPNDQPADTMTVTRGNHTYYLDYHIYLYTVTIRTVADIYLYDHKGIGQLPLWQHETSWPHECLELGNDYGYNTYVGEKFDGGVYVKFVINPWKGISYHEAPTTDDPDEEWYVLDNCWAGVMNTYILEKDQGQIENQWGETPDPDGEAPMFVKAGLDEGNQVPMYQDDGTFGGTLAPKINWDPTVTPDARIESTVVHYLPCQLQPGLKTNTDWKGCVVAIYPCDVYIQYTLRVDVLQVHGFVLETAHHPPTPSSPVDYFSWARGFWENIANWFANPWNLAGIGVFTWLLLIGIVVVVLFWFFGPPAHRRRGL